MAADHAHGRPPATPPLNHELSDADPGPILKFLAFLVAGTVLTGLLVVPFYNYLERREAVEKTARHPMSLIGVERPLPPPPRLQTYPFQDIKELRQHDKPCREGDGSRPCASGRRHGPAGSGFDRMPARCRGIADRAPAHGPAGRTSAAGVEGGEPSTIRRSQTARSGQAPALGQHKRSRQMTPRVLIAAALVTCLSAGSAWAQSTPSLYRA